jgi:hypothetical protein
MEHVEKAKIIIDKYCRKHLFTSGPWKACTKESCKECDYNEAMASEIIEAIENNQL